MRTDYGTPLTVSPLIKFSRWSLLLLGVFYGGNKKMIYSKLEADHRKKKQQLKEAKLAKALEAERLRKEKKQAKLDRGK